MSEAISVPLNLTQCQEIRHLFNIHILWLIKRLNNFYLIKLAFDIVKEIIKQEITILTSWILELMERFLYFLIAIEFIITHTLSLQMFYRNNRTDVSHQTRCRQLAPNSNVSCNTQS